MDENPFCEATGWSLVSIFERFRDACGLDLREDRRFYPVMEPPDILHVLCHKERTDEVLHPDSTE
jgi:hypothetical protein